MRRVLALMFAFTLLSCSGGEAATADDEAPAEASAEESSAEAAESEDETTVEEPELAPADKVAAAVLERAGANDLSQAKEIRFSFVVSTKGEEVFRARHRYNRVANTDRVTWINPDSPIGKRFDLLIDLEDKHVEGKIDGEPISDMQREKIRPLVYQRWVNDYYWYAMPMKLDDPGVKLHKMPQRDWKGVTYDVIEMTFEGTGLTPGDRYILYVHPERDRIERWDMDLQGSDGEPVQVARTNFEQLGPLYLSHDHVWINGDKRVDIRDVSVSDTVDKDDFEFDDSDFVYDAFENEDASTIDGGGENTDGDAARSADKESDSKKTSK